MQFKEAMQIKPIYKGDDGILYERLHTREASIDPEAERFIDKETKLIIWLKPLALPKTD